MTTRKKWLSFCLILWLALAAGGLNPAQASSDDLSPQQIRAARQQGEIKPLRWVLKHIQAEYPGRVLDVELSKKKNKDKYQTKDKKPNEYVYIYKIKLLQNDGYITKLYIDASNAEVLRVKTRHDKNKYKHLHKKRKHD